MSQQQGVQGIVLGPLMRYVDEDSASIWVETAEAGSVEVRTEQGTWSAATFGVHGHHFALVECHDLAPGSKTAYEVHVDGVLAWPVADSDGGLDLPRPIIATLQPGKPLRLAFGSCRTSVSHDEEGNTTHGIDALRAYALAMAGVTAPEGEMRWPDLALFLGDQVYADETTEAMQEFISSRRDIDEPPGEELADFEEYAHLYLLAWSDPANRWLLSTLPTAMIFDDHDVRDDWNTSQAWLEEIRRTEWWHGRIVAGLASYWVYQHLGNMSPSARAEDEVFALVRAHDGPDELDLSETLDAFADRVDKHPESYRWSYARELAGCRLVVVDSRAGRVLAEGERAILDEVEMTWLDEQMTGNVEHLLIGTSLPFMLPTGLHHLEAFDEALAGGAWGRRAARFGEYVRQGVDLEHWGAFQDSFQRVARMAIEVAAGERGRAPRTVTFLSGDVHHSYVSKVTGVLGTRIEGTILQAVCSPMRNPLPRVFRFATAALAYGVAGPIGVLASQSRSVPRSPLRWEQTAGPWFDNNLATLDVHPDSLEMWWATGEVKDGRHDRPHLRRVTTVTVDHHGRVRAE